LRVHAIGGGYEQAHWEKQSSNRVSKEILTGKQFALPNKLKGEGEEKRGGQKKNESRAGKKKHRMGE